MKVSVIIPVYNASVNLKETLDSVFSSTLPDIEIIAIDDASTDDSLAILNQYKDKIKVLHLKDNLGTGAVRNIGIEIATGEYIGFVDSDDYVNKDMYTNLFNAAKSNDFPDIVSGGITFVKDNSLVNSVCNCTFRQVNPKKDKKSIIDFSPSVCNKLFKRSFLKDTKFIEGTKWEDVSFTYSCLFSANDIVYTNMPMYYYDRHNDYGVSATNYKPNDHVFDIFKVCDDLEENLRDNGIFESVKEEVRLIQISYSLERAVEVLDWDINDSKKNEMVSKICTMVYSKYGDYRKIPKEVLSSKIGIFNLEKFTSVLDQSIESGKEKIR